MCSEKKVPGVDLSQIWTLQLFGSKPSFTLFWRFWRNGNGRGTRGKGSRCTDIAGHLPGNPDENSLQFPPLLPSNTLHLDIILANASLKSKVFSAQTLQLEKPKRCRVWSVMMLERVQLSCTTYSSWIWRIRRYHNNGFSGFWSDFDWSQSFLGGIGVDRGSVQDSKFRELLEVLGVEILPAIAIFWVWYSVVYYINLYIIHLYQH